MPFAITLRLDTAAASLVEAMWQTIASRGVSDDALRPGYAPHLTIAVFPDSADQGRLTAVARSGAARWRALPITFGSLGVFPCALATIFLATIFLAPVVTPALLALHTDVLDSLAGEAVDPHYRSNHWVPHVTLASDLIDPAAAIAALGPPRLPIDGVLNTVEVVRFRPVQILASHRLVDA
jgi:2'-5' RNA ligase